MDEKKSTGLCKVLKKNFLFPEGTTPEMGQEFDPMVKKMSLGRYHSLIAGRYITPAGQEIEHRMQVEWARKDKGVPVPAPCADEKVKDEAPIRRGRPPRNKK